jgi:hypothetical protein
MAKMLAAPPSGPESPGNTCTSRAFGALIVTDSPLHCISRMTRPPAIFASGEENASNAAQPATPSWNGVAGENPGRTLSSLWPTFEQRANEVRAGLARTCWRATFSFSSVVSCDVASRSVAPPWPSVRNALAREVMHGRHSRQVIETFCGYSGQCVQLPGRLSNHRLEPMTWPEALWRNTSNTGRPCERDACSSSCAVTALTSD